MKEKTPKSRIISTIILTLFVIGCVYFTIVFLPVSWSSVKEAVENTEVDGSDPSGQVVATGAVAFAAGLGMIMVFLIECIVAFFSGVCLPFSIRNIKSSLKPIRIISIIYTALLGFSFITSAVKIILFFVGA